MTLLPVFCIIVRGHCDSQRGHYDCLREHFNFQIYTIVKRSYNKVFIEMDLSFMYLQLSVAILLCDETAFFSYCVSNSFEKA